MVVEEDGLFTMAGDAHEIVAYYANAIAHLDGNTAPGVIVASISPELLPTVVAAAN